MINKIRSSLLYNVREKFATNDAASSYCSVGTQRCSPDEDALMTSIYSDHTPHIPTIAVAI